MKASTRVILVTVLVFMTGSIAFAHNKVAVIPLNTAKKLDNIVTVSAKGGDFTDPVAAVNSITDASVNNPYLVIIGPGVYTLTQTLNMKPYVSIAGSGEEVTTLTGAISTNASSTSAIIKGANNATLSDLTIENTGGSLYSAGIYNTSSSPYITDVTVKASGGTNGNYAITNESSSSPTMYNVTASASGGSSSNAVYNVSSSPTMTNVTANASGGTSSNRGIYILSSSPALTDVTATASGSGGAFQNYGIWNFGSSSSTLTNVTASGSGPSGSGIGLMNENSFATIRHCTFEGTSSGVFSDQIPLGGVSTVRIMQSSIIGGAFISAGTLTCVNSDDGVATALNGTCQ